MRASFVRWWLLPFGILAASALVALNIVVFGPSFMGRSSAEVAQQLVRETATDCSGALATDYACHQERYQSLVSDSGVEAAFVELKDAHANNEFLKKNCHQMTHVIGRSAADLYGDDIPAAYSRGDHLCGMGYYHGVMEAVVARVGADKILEEANTLCADLGEHQRYSVYHHGCVHGLGHGFMGVLENELFEALEACDSLTDGQEKKLCYGGVFMENVMAQSNPTHPSKYLKADQPLYPCTEVETRYKEECYKMQTSYALQTQSGDFSKVFDLCGEVEDDFRASCYRGLGMNVLGESISNNVTDVAQVGSANMLCMLGEDHEARSNCVVGAVRGFILLHHDAQARAFCESQQDADLRTACLQAGEKYYENFAID